MESPSIDQCSVCFKERMCRPYWANGLPACTKCDVRLRSGILDAAAKDPEAITQPVRMIENLCKLLTWYEA